MADNNLLKEFILIVLKEELEWNGYDYEESVPERLLRKGGRFGKKIGKALHKTSFKHLKLKKAFSEPELNTNHIIQLLKDNANFGPIGDIFKGVVPAYNRAYIIGQYLVQHREIQVKKVSNLARQIVIAAEEIKKTLNK